jgi:hypothetical protein
MHEDVRCKLLDSSTYSVPVLVMVSICIGSNCILNTELSGPNLKLFFVGRFEL